MKKLFYWITAAVFSVVVMGCSATAPVDENADVSASAAGGAGKQTKKEMAQEDEDMARDGVVGEGPLLSRTTIYFELDSSEIQADFHEVLRAHGNHLVAHPEIRITIEGHTDERGSREYNLALGERRALAVRQLLILQGVAAEQLDVVSFGEERPVSYEHDEAGWRLNRRAYLHYMGH